MKNLIFLFLLVIPFFIQAQLPAPFPNTYVNDLSGVLKPDEIKALNESVLAIENKSSVQIAIVLVNELPGNVEIEDYARQIGRKWHVGNARNGLVYVAAINQHKQRLEVASELEGDIPDLEARNITDGIKPYFKTRDYSGGLQQLLNGINQRLDPVLKEQQKLAEAERKKKQQQFNHVFANVLMCIGGVGLSVLAAWYFFFLPVQKRKRKEREAQEAKERAERRNIKITRSNLFTSSNNDRHDFVAPVTTTQSGKEGNDYSSRSSSSTSSSDDSSSYGNWGSGSSDSSSNDSGFSGGGSSNDW